MLLFLADPNDAKACVCGGECINTHFTSEKFAKKIPRAISTQESSGDIEDGSCSSAPDAGNWVTKSQRGGGCGKLNPINFSDENSNLTR